MSTIEEKKYHRVVIILYRSDPLTPSKSLRIGAPGNWKTDSVALFFKSKWNTINENEFPCHGKPLKTVDSLDKCVRVCV